MTIQKIEAPQVGEVQDAARLAPLKAMEDIHWFHSVDLGSGMVTRGQVDMASWQNACLFDRLDFQGKSVLDVGCWDGYFSFEAEKRGAQSVLALDDTKFRWGGLDGFNFLHSHFKSKVDWQRGSVFKIPRESFDIVLCYGVLQQVNDPFTAATNCFQSSNDRVVIEGYIFEAQAAVSVLRVPGEIDSNRNDMYAVSTGFLDRVANLNGFIRECHLSAPHNPPNPAQDRCAVIYKKVADKKPEFPKDCFSTPPTCLID